MVITDQEFDNYKKTKDDQNKQTANKRKVSLKDEKQMVLYTHTKSTKKTLLFALVTDTSFVGGSLYSCQLLSNILTWKSNYFMTICRIYLCIRCTFRSTSFFFAVVVDVLIVLLFFYVNCVWRFSLS